MSWRTVKISDVLKQYRIEHRVQNETLYKQVSILNDGSVVLRGEKIGKEIGRKRQFLIDIKKYPRTLIFTRQLLLQGSIGMAYDEVHNCIVTENMPMFSVDVSKVDIDFFSLFIKSDVFRRQVRRVELKGSAQKSIHEKTFLQLEIPLPTLKEQKEIIKTYSKIHSQNSVVRNEIRNQHELVKQLRQSFLREAVQGKLVKQDKEEGNAKELLQKIKAEKTKLKNEKEFSPIKESEIAFAIPENWQWCRIGEIGNLKRGKSKHRPRDDQRLFQNGTYPFIQTGDVSKAKYNNDLITTVNNYYSEFGLMQSEIQRKGTLCITIAANIAECGFLNFDACVPDSIVCFSSIDKVIEKYTYYYLKIAKEELERFAPATAQKNINLGILNDFPIPLPPLAEQKRIVKKLEEVMNLCEELKTTITDNQNYTNQHLQVALKDALQMKEEIEAT